MEKEVEIRMKRLREGIPFLKRHIERLEQLKNSQSKNFNEVHYLKYIELHKWLIKDASKLKIKKRWLTTCEAALKRIRFYEYDSAFRTSQSLGDPIDNIDLTGSESPPPIVTLSSDESEPEVVEIPDERRVSPVAHTEKPCSSNDGSSSSSGDRSNFIWMTQMRRQPTHSHRLTHTEVSTFAETEQHLNTKENANAAATEKSVQNCSNGGGGGGSGEDKSEQCHTAQRVGATRAFGQYICHYDADGKKLPILLSQEQQANLENQQQKLQNSPTAVGSPRDSLYHLQEGQRARIAIPAYCHSESSTTTQCQQQVSVSPSLAEARQKLQQMTAKSSLDNNWASDVQDRECHGKDIGSPADIDSVGIGAKNLYALTTLRPNDNVTSAQPLWNNPNRHLSINSPVNNFGVNRYNTGLPATINFNDPRVRKAHTQSSTIYSQPSIYQYANNQAASTQLPSMCNQNSNSTSPPLSNVMGAFHQEYRNLSVPQDPRLAPNKNYGSHSQYANVANIAAAAVCDPRQQQLPQARTYLEYKQAKAQAAALRKQRQQLEESRLAIDKEKRNQQQQNMRENCNVAVEVLQNSNNKRCDVSGELVEKSNTHVGQLTTPPVEKTHLDRVFCFETPKVVKNDNNNNNTVKLDKNKCEKGTPRNDNNGKQKLKKTVEDKEKTKEDNDKSNKKKRKRKSKRRKSKNNTNVVETDSKNRNNDEDTPKENAENVITIGQCPTKVLDANKSNEDSEKEVEHVAKQNIEPPLPSKSIEHVAKLIIEPPLSNKSIEHAAKQNIEPPLSNKSIEHVAKQNIEPPLSNKSIEHVAKQNIEPLLPNAMPSENLNVDKNTEAVDNEDKEAVIGGSKENDDRNDELLEIMAKQPLAKVKSTARRGVGKPKRVNRDQKSQRNALVKAVASKSTASRASHLPNASSESSASTIEHNIIRPCVVRLKQLKVPLAKPQQQHNKRKRKRSKDKPTENNDDVPLNARSKRAKMETKLANEFEVIAFYENAPLAKLKNANPKWHARSKCSKCCIICDKRVPSIVIHYIQNHGEHYGARVLPNILQKLKQGKLNKPAHMVPNKTVKCFFKCPFCLEAERMAMTSWFEHFAKHTGEYHYQCSKCRLPRTGYATMLSHVKSCGKQAKMIKHNFQTINEMSNLKAHVCHLCNYIQLCRSNLDRHYVQQHGYPKDDVAILGYSVVLLMLDGVPWISEKKAIELEKELRHRYKKESLLIEDVEEEEAATVKQEDQKVEEDFWKNLEFLINDIDDDDVPVTNELLRDDVVDNATTSLAVDDSHLTEEDIPMTFDDIKPIRISVITTIHDFIEESVNDKTEKGVDDKEAIESQQQLQQETQQQTQPSTTTQSTETTTQTPFPKLEEDLISESTLTISKITSPSQRTTMTKGYSRPQNDQSEKRSEDALINDQAEKAVDDKEAIQSQQQLQQEIQQKTQPVTTTQSTETIVCVIQKLEGDSISESALTISKTVSPSQQMTLTTEYMRPQHLTKKCNVEVSRNKDEWIDFTLLPGKLNGDSSKGPNKAPTSDELSNSTTSTSSTANDTSHLQMPTNHRPSTDNIVNGGSDNIDHHAQFLPQLMALERPMMSHKDESSPEPNQQQQQQLATKSTVENVAFAQLAYKGQHKNAFYCLTPNCSFHYSNDIISLQAHFYRKHPNTSWSGYCQTCRKQLAVPGVRYALQDEILHLFDVHFVSESAGADNSIDVSGGHQLQKIKVRRLSGDRLSCFKDANRIMT